MEMARFAAAIAAAILKTEVAEKPGR